MSGVIGDDAGGAPDGIIAAIGVKSDVTNFVPTLVGDATIVAPIAAYSGISALSPEISEPGNADITAPLAAYSGITPLAPLLSDPSFVFNILDDWVDQGTFVSIGSPGSRAFTEAPNRMMVAHAVNVGAAAQDIIGLSYGGQAMTLVQDAASTGGRDMDSSLWILNQAGLTAAVGTSFVVDPASGPVQFRMRTAAYENVDQASPVVSSASVQSVSAGDDPIPVSLATADDSEFIAAVSINAGVDDDGTEDVVFSNMTERVQDDASSNQYSSVAVQATDGTDFTPALTTTQTGRISHLLQLAMRSATASPDGALVPPLGSYSGITALLPAVAEPAPETIAPGLDAYSGITAFLPVIEDITIQAPLAAYSGITGLVPSIFEPSEDVSLLNAWSLESTLITAPGSKTVSAGSDRLLLVMTLSRGSPGAVTLTDVSFGGQPMTLEQEVLTTAGPDFQIAVWSLNEVGISAAIGNAFTVTPSAGTLRFRLVAGSYQAVDQVVPILDRFGAGNEAGENPTEEAMDTVGRGVALAFIGANRGTSDGGATEDASYSNMTELLEDETTTTYLSIATADPIGSSFTPGTTLTHQTAGALIGVSIQSLSEIIGASIGSYSGLTAFLPIIGSVSAGVIVAPLAIYSGITAISPDVFDTAGEITSPLGAYSGVTALLPEVAEILGSITSPLAVYSGITAFLPNVDDISVQAPFGAYSGVTALLPVIESEFEPTDIADLLLWYDADDTSTITDTAGEVSQWDDKSGNGNDLVQATAAQQPNTSTINGNASLQFDGGDLLLDAAISAAGDPDDMTIVSVITPDDIAGNEDYMGFYSAAGGVRLVARKTTATVQWFVNGTASSTTALLLGAVAGDTRWEIWRTRTNANGGNDALDSSGITATDAGTDTAFTDNAQFAIGATPAVGTGFSGHVHEVFAYNRRLLDAERTQISDYLDDKWTTS